MKYLAILVVFPLLYSCSWEHRLARYCPHCTQEESQSDSTIVHHTKEVVTEPVYIYRSPDSLLLQALVECDSANRAQMQATTIESAKQKITVSIHDGVVKTKSECKEDSLLVELKHTRELLEKIKTEKKVIQLPQEKILVYPGKFFYWWFAATALILLAILFYGIRKRGYK